MFQVAMLFIIGVILTGMISTVALYRFSTRYVMKRLETSGKSTAEDLKGFIYDYPAHGWLLRYWYEHYDEMDIEYDAVYSDGTMTEEKYAPLTELHPEFRLEYANTED